MINQFHLTYGRNLYPGDISMPFFLKLDLRCYFSNGIDLIFPTSELKHASSTFFLGSHNHFLSRVFKLHLFWGYICTNTCIYALTLHICVLSRVVCISFCSEKGNFLSGSLDRTVLLWDQWAEKSQVKLMMLCTIVWHKLNFRFCFTTCLCQLNELQF